MKTVYEYIKFWRTDHIAAGKECWECINKKSNSPLCAIGYYKPWHQWVMLKLADDAVFNNQCLLDIADFLDQLNEKKK